MVFSNLRFERTLQQPASPPVSASLKLHVGVPIAVSY